MRPQRSQTFIRAHLSWLLGGLVIISRCDICQWVQGLATSPYPHPRVLDQHNIYCMLEYSTTLGLSTVPARLRLRPMAKSHCPNATEANSAASTKSAWSATIVVGMHLQTNGPVLLLTTDREEVVRQEPRLIHLHHYLPIPICDVQFRLLYVVVSSLFRGSTSDGVSFVG
jgi:hypothetical protein